MSLSGERSTQSCGYIVYRREGDGVIGFSFLCLGRGLFRFRRCRRLDFFGGSVRPRQRNGWESALLVGDGTGLVSTAGGGSGCGLHAFSFSFSFSFLLFFVNEWGP